MDESGSEASRLVTTGMLRDLPEVVQRYLTYAGVVGKPWINTVHLRQEGRFRLASDRPWMPVTAVQYYTTGPPGFVWNARFKLAGLPLLRARDAYEDGHGHMFGRLAGLFTVFNVHGEQLDQGAMLRYLNEMMWFPTAFLGENITWQGVDDHSARVTFTDHGKSVSALMTFDAQGRLVNFEAMRYRENHGSFSLDPWSTPVTEYGVRAGLNLPVSGKAVWNLSSGELSYAELDITHIEYNRSVRSF
jgi:hypothetical protein